MIDIETPTPTRPEHRLLLASLQDKLEGKMTQEELGSICYLWTLQYVWDELRFNPLPTIPPDLYKWRGMDVKIKRALDEQSLQYYHALARDYNAQYCRIDNGNWAKLQWLREMYHWFEKEGKERYLVQVKERIQEFEIKGVGKKYAKRSI